MYTREPATGDVKHYLDWILSDEGQCILKKYQYSTIREVKCEE